MAEILSLRHRPRQVSKLAVPQSLSHQSGSVPAVVCCSAAAFNCGDRRVKPEAELQDEPIEGVQMRSIISTMKFGRFCLQRVSICTVSHLRLTSGNF